MISISRPVISTGGYVDYPYHTYYSYTHIPPPSHIEIHTPVTPFPKYSSINLPLTEDARKYKFQAKHRQAAHPTVLTGIGTDTPETRTYTCSQFHYAAFILTSLSLSRHTLAANSTSWALSDGSMHFLLKRSCPDTPERSVEVAAYTTESAPYTDVIM